ncbi:hypothetical protein BH20ACT5_BH20ACT5_16960 [soil metagenome]
MTPTDQHLALEAIVALVDGELSRGAHGRAMAHLSACQQCRHDVEAQRYAKRALVGAGGPALPADLLSRLREIPFTTDLGTPEVTLAMQGDSMQWRSTYPAALAPAPLPIRPPVRLDRQTRPGDQRPSPSPVRRRPHLSPVRLSRLRRGLVGAVAGVTVGVLASVAPVAVTASGGVSTPRPAEDTELPEWSSTFTPLGETIPAVAGISGP